jgi:hypothetical protein
MTTVSQNYLDLQYSRLDELNRRDKRDIGNLRPNRYQRIIVPSKYSDQLESFLRMLPTAEHVAKVVSERIQIHRTVRDRGLGFIQECSVDQETKECWRSHRSETTVAL